MDNNVVVKVPPNPFVGRGHDLKGKKLTEEEKYFLGAYAGQADKITSKVAKYYNINVRTLQNYVTNVYRGIKPKESGGRRPALEENDYREIKAWIRDSVFEIKTSILHDKINEVARKRANKRGISDCQFNPLSENTIVAIERKLGTKSAHAEEITSARSKAIADVQNAVSFAVMNKVVVPLSHPDLIMNVDATQFTVGEGSDGEIEVKYVDHKRNTPFKVEESSEVGGGGMNFFIKYYLLMCAGGFQAAPIYIVADDVMPKGEIDVHKVIGLGIGTDMNSFGYVVFCQSRSLCSAFYEWFNSTVLIPFVVDIRTARGIPDSTVAWFQLDGEATQIAIYENATVLAALHEHNIVVGKPPGSTTAITQACDRGNCFKGPKTKLKKVKNCHVSDNILQLDRISAIFKLHIDKYKPPATTSKHKEKQRISYNHAKQAKLGILRVQYALQNCMKPSMIRESFSLCGIYPFSIDVILSQCTTRITPEEQLHICDRLNSLVAIMREKGELKDTDFERAKIGLAGAVRKDHLAMNQRRSIILTNIKWIEEAERKRKEKEEVAAAPKKRAVKRKAVAEVQEEPLILKFKKHQSNTASSNSV